ncbi:SCP2 sterol-binding domain-containing protein [Temperatibacter marinus]|uniref:SCP2 sterol-binding domain-containing protein n=1 Tax=Temperatibacter marinus TaxID=1456591 RepID=A0AA52HAL6_9PROT|nr:SCP2 sterol-binding domain-containing protein [Temperatibacter marinus]WND02870.1 SCP2 sterol-binding domain-containing protein [Temperatibacter marinus]
MSLEDLTSQIRDRVGNHSPIEAIIKFDFDEDGVVRIDGKVSPTVVDNENSEADCTIKTTLETFAAIAKGEQNPQMAFMMGKLRVEGDMSLAMQLGSILG